MHSVKILHTADMHLGSVYSGLPYEKANLSRSEAVYTCINVVKSAQDLDALILSGDIFDSGSVSTSFADMLLDAVEKISPVPVFFACGNHDNYYTDIIRYCADNAPKNLHIFPPDVIECVTIEDKKLKIYGASFSKEHYLVSMLDDFPPCDDDYINILCIHGDVMQGDFNPIDIQKLSKLGIDYAALGHIHSFDGIKKTGSLSWAYPGIPEGRGFDECGEKGYIKGEVFKNNTGLKFYPSCKRCYIDEKIDISDFNNKYELAEVLNSMSLSPNNICRFTLVGENNFSYLVDTDFLASSCTAYHTVFVDKTALALSFEEYTGLTGLKGLCAKEAKKIIDGEASAYEKEKYKKAFKLLTELFENK